MVGMLNVLLCVDQTQTINELSDATSPTLCSPFLASLMITIQYARSIYNKNELEQSSTIILIARSFVAILFCIRCHYKRDITERNAVVLRRIKHKGLNITLMTLLQHIQEFKFFVINIHIYLRLISDIVIMQSSYNSLFKSHKKLDVVRKRIIII